jgi:hypothetical protein
LYNQRRRERSTDNGIIYPMLFLLIKLLFFLNIVEWIKNISDYFTSKIYKTHTERKIVFKIRRNRNFVIDLFIIIKFSIVTLFLFKGMDSIWIKFIVWYLLISNVYTYFYYHLWCNDALLEKYQTIHRVRRRFISLFISVAFMILCYTYLYSIMIPEHFILGMKDSEEIVISMITSISRSFAIDYEGLKPKTNTGTIIEITQVINMFVFFTILLAKSLPKANQE